MGKVFVYVPVLNKRDPVILRLQDPFFVELEGVEPSSKQGTNLLSTCLSSL